VALSRDAQLVVLGSASEPEVTEHSLLLPLLLLCFLQVALSRGAQLVVLGSASELEVITPSLSLLPLLTLLSNVAGGAVAWCAAGGAGLRK
jgi:hypothetical protein